MDNEPLSQQADSSPNKSGEQFSKLLPLQREQLPKAPPHVKGAAKGTVLKAPPLSQGRCPKGAEGYD